MIEPTDEMVQLALDIFLATPTNSIAQIDAGMSNALAAAFAIVERDYELRRRTGAVYVWTDRGPVAAEPNACMLCGIPQRGHGQRFGPHHRGARSRTYVLPDDATRLARMQARRGWRRP